MNDKTYRVQTTDGQITDEVRFLREAASKAQDRANYMREPFEVWTFSEHIGWHRVQQRWPYHRDRASG